MNKLKSKERKNVSSPRLPWGAAIGIAGVCFGAAIWAIGALQTVPNPAEDPNWISLAEVKTLQAELEQANRQQRQAQDRLRQVQQSQAQLTAKLRQTLPLDQIPGPLRAPSAELTAVNIRTMWEQQQSFSSETVDALLVVLSHILDAGIINTNQPADSPDTQTLYRSVQIMLQGIGTYNGPITGTQEETFKALTQFQEARKLKIDGKMGMKTFGAIAEQFQNTLSEQSS